MATEDGARKFFEKLKIVETFCGGDVETAKKILKGEYTDIIAIKGRFKDKDDQHLGLFLVFVSKITRKVVNARSVISSSTSVFHHKPFDNWKVFYGKLEKELAEAEIDAEKTATLDGVLSRLHELKFFPEIFGWVERNDIMNLTDRFQLVVRNVLGVEDIHVVLDFENISSLLLYEEKGIKPI